MRTKVTLVLILLNVALFFFIFYLKSGIRAPHDTSAIFGPEIANIQAIEISGPARPQTTRLERRGDNWVLTAPLDWPANEFAVTRIVNELQQLTSTASFAVKDLKEGQSLADYGLDKPPLTVTITPASTDTDKVPPHPPITLRIGDAAKVGNRLYVLSPDGQRIHVVQRSLADSLSVKLEDLRSDTIFSIRVFEVRSLNVQTGAPSPSKVRIARNDSRWFFETPITTRADKNATDSTITNLDALRIQNFVDPHSSEPTRLTPDDMSLRVTLDGNNRRETLVLGARVHDTALLAAAASPTPPPAEGQPAPPPEETEVYYAKMEDKAPIFTVAVPVSLLNHLRNAQEKLRDPRILDVDPSKITALTLSAAGQPDLILQRLESTSDNPLKSSWQMIRRPDDHGQQTTPADREVVEKLIQNLCDLTAEKFVWDAPVESALEEDGFNRPARRIKIAIAPPRPAGAAAVPTTGNGDSVVLLLGIGVDRQIYAKLETPNFVYRVSNDILQQIPLDPLAYRERVLRDLPAGAKITELKLVDLANQSVLLDTPLPLTGAGAENPAPGAPVLTPATRVAVEALATQLRTLRAKRFVKDEFSNTVVVGGEERPWRYQLTATIALIGGSGTQTETSVLFLSERVGGTTQLVGAPKLNVVFEAEQPLLDALFALIYGPHDPGATPPKPGQSE